jgi:multicomponent Na+:H+ antiporter subunit E
MTGSVDPARGVVLRSVLGRAVFFFVFWLVLSSTKPADVVVGALSAAAATWVSLRLLPAGQWRLDAVALAKLMLRFPGQSIVAGIDVAWRAFDPRLPLQPGFLVYRSRLAPGPTREAFLTLASMMPGTLPCGHDVSGGVVIHCLDVRQPVLDQMAADEALLAQALGAPRGNE